MSVLKYTDPNTGEHKRLYGIKVVGVTGTPTGTKIITTNGTHDVAEYAFAEVNVPASGVDLPTLTTPGSADDLASGKQLIDANGNVVTGTVKEYSDSFVTPPESGTIEWDDDWAVRNTLNEDALLRKGTTVTTWLPQSVFGNAFAEDVAVGKTFTSHNGIKIVGTNKFRDIKTITIKEV